MGTKNDISLTNNFGEETQNAINNGGQLNVGTGAPDFDAPAGALYVRSDATGSSDWLYQNADEEGNDWTAFSGGGGGAPEGTSVLSTGETAGKILTADGADGSTWGDVPPVFALGTFNLTFGAGVGVVAVVYKAIQNLLTLEFPAGTTADGAGTTIASGAMSTQFRPDADISFPVVVVDNGVSVFGKVVVAASGVVTFSVGAAGTAFTDDAVAGWARTSVTYGT